MNTGERLRETATGLVGQTPTEINNVEDMEAAAAHLSELAGVASEMDKERLAEGKPHRDASAAINLEYSPVADSVKLAIANLKLIVGTYRVEQLRLAEEREAEARRVEEERLAEIREKERKEATKRREEEALARAIEEKNEALLEPEAIEAAVEEDMKANEETRPVVTPRPRVQAHTPTLSTRKVIDYRIVEARKIPRRFYDLNEGRIRAEVKAKGMDTQIPGIEVFPEEKIVTKRAQ